MNNKKPTVSGASGLKPLPQKKPIPLKPTVLESSNRTAVENKPTASKKVAKIFEAVRKKEWSNKKGQEYDGPVDYDQPELEEDNYFEMQL